MFPAAENRRSDSVDVAKIYTGRTLPALLHLFSTRTEDSSSWTGSLFKWHRCQAVGLSQESDMSPPDNTSVATLVQMSGMSAVQGCSST